MTDILDAPTPFGTAVVREVRLLSGAEAAAAARAVLAAPEQVRHAGWTAPSCSMWTVGEPFYRNRERPAYYRDRALAENPIMYGRYRWLLDRVGDLLEHRYGALVCFARELAVPGFHVFEYGAPGEYGGGGWHLDRLYDQVPQLVARSASISRIVNVTLPLMVPDGGAGMDLRDAGVEVTIRYRPGVMVFTEAEYWHQIGTTTCQRAGERRVTLQGHGVEIDGRWVLYW